MTSDIDTFIMTYIGLVEKAKTLFNLSFFRLRWPAFGPIADTLVMDDATDTTSPLVPSQTMSGDGTVTLHPLADEPLTIRPVSSMSVYIEALEYYSSCWWDFHIDDSPGMEKKDCPCGYEDRDLDFTVVVIPEEPRGIEFEFEDNGPEDIPKMWEQRARHARKYIKIGALYK
jgi:hypothetical protein